MLAPAFIMGITLNVIIFVRRVCCQLLIVLVHKQRIGTGRLNPSVITVTKHRNLPIRPERETPRLSVFQVA